MRSNGLISLLFFTTFFAMTGSNRATTPDLDLVVGDRERSIKTTEHLGRQYLRLEDLARALDFDINREADSLKLVASRGTIELSDGRPLVRVGQQYILLSSPIWRRKRNEWYVPEDFLTKALPSILVRRIEADGQDRYRVSLLAERVVQVRVGNHPDHVSVVLELPPDLPVTVRELRDVIEVQFSDYLVHPRIESARPDSRYVQSIDFDRNQDYGTLIIHKGRAFSNYRRVNLTDPRRLVINVYADELVAESVSVAPDEPAPPGGATGGLGPPPVPLASSSDVAPLDPVSLPDVISPRIIRDVCMIDPGHGGSDHGVSAGQQIFEKNLALQLGQRLQSYLAQQGLPVRFTRSRDVNLPPEQRAAVANFYRSRVFISIHFGGAPTGSTRGPVVYVYAPASGAGTRRSLPRSADGSLLADDLQGPGMIPWSKGQAKFTTESRRLAELIQNGLNELFGAENTVVELPLAVLEPIQAPAVLIEAGFLTSRTDLDRLQQASFIDQIAATINRAVGRFLR